MKHLFSYASIPTRLQAMALSVFSFEGSATALILSERSSTF